MCRWLPPASQAFEQCTLVTGHEGPHSWCKKAEAAHAAELSRLLERKRHISTRHPETCRAGSFMSPTQVCTRPAGHAGDHDLRDLDMEPGPVLPKHPGRKPVWMRISPETGKWVRVTDAAEIEKAKENLRKIEDHYQAQMDALSKWKAPTFLDHFVADVAKPTFLVFTLVVLAFTILMNWLLR
jgi:hypothetical protein